MLAESRPENSLEQRLQLLIEAVTDYGIFMLDPEGHIVSWNSGAQKLKGYRRDEILGKHFSVFYPREAIESGWPQEELRLARQRYQQGVADNREVVEAQNRLAIAEDNLVEALYQYNLSRLELARAKGDVRTVLGEKVQ